MFLPIYQNTYEKLNIVSCIQIISLHDAQDKHVAAAAAAKSLQSCPTLCNPIGSSPPGSPVPGILQTKVLEWVTIAFSILWLRDAKN